ncbi:DUF805 domain-containing protein [Pediococcus pentosaceus]|nr:DUF805 domain-containing protein [Pediococcus pentosaceus]MBY4581433.1 DUF805 domain-containing protein [Pediococcus pentosaceus]UQA99773.1 DUF805 domain-containing protein [Pediococcus pentosaceus]
MHISADIRKLHDIRRSGWCWLLGLITIINILLIFFLADPSIIENNKYKR